MFAANVKSFINFFNSTIKSLVGKALNLEVEIVVNSEVVILLFFKVNHRVFITICKYTKYNYNIQA
jgi:hypothetical protein